MKIERPWALWGSGFLAAFGGAHAVPLLIRHDLVIAGLRLTTTATLVTAVVSFALSAGLFRLAGLTRA